MYKDRERTGTGELGWSGGREREHERSRQEKRARGGWVRRQTQFGVVVVAVECIDHLLIVVFESTNGDWCAHVSVCVCVCVVGGGCMCVFVHLAHNRNYA